MKISYKESHHTLSATFKGHNKAAYIKLDQTGWTCYLSIDGKCFSPHEYNVLTEEDIVKELTEMKFFKHWYQLEKFYTFFEIYGY